MPPKKQSAQVAREPSLDQIVRAVGLYPAEAYEFIQHGLAHTVDKLHGPDAGDESAKRHIRGQLLCHGLLDYAFQQWGMLAGLVLRQWHISTTLDFGQIVFAMIHAGYMQKSPADSLEDFRNVFDFREAFDQYKIGQGSTPAAG